MRDSAKYFLPIKVNVTNKQNIKLRYVYKFLEKKVSFDNIFMGLKFGCKAVINPPMAQGNININ